MITTDDRTAVQAAIPLGSSKRPRVVSELERLLREPGCPACTYVAEIERSFFSWFQIESFSSPQVQAQLRAALGMCPAHSRRLVEEPGEGHIMTTVAREALTGALDHVRGELQVGVCPACEAAATGSRHACRLVLDGLLDPVLNRLYSDHGGMCLGHVLESFPTADPRALKALAERLLGRLFEDAGPALVAVLAGSDEDTRRRGVWRRGLPALPSSDSTVNRLELLLEFDACPICLSTGVGERDYFEWFLNQSATGDRSLRSDPGEFCPRHLHDVANLDASSAVVAIEHKRTARIAHLERFLPRLSQLPVPGRRGRRSKPDGLDQVQAELLAVPYCAACNAHNGLERSRLDLMSAGVALGPIRERYDRSHGLCLRHVMQLADGHAARVTRRHVDARLAMLAWEVGETARKYAWAYRHEPNGPEHDGWLRALAQIDGRVFAGGPAPAGLASDGPERK